MKSGNEEQAMEIYAEIMNKESKDGWILHSLTNISLFEKPGCIAGLFGKKKIVGTRDVLVFCKE